MGKKENIEFGDRVEVSRSKEIYEGIYLPSSEAGSFLLKLDNGYNIGFNKKDIFDIKVISRRENKKEHFEILEDGSKPNVALIITGGTIAAKSNPGKGGVDWLDTPEELFKFYPEMFKKVNVKKVEIPFMKASEDMDYKDWQKIAKVCEKLLNDKSISGVIVTHGTDFLHYTAAALSFMLGKLNKPVVLTYSQRSIDRASSDANLNLICSAEVAGLSDISEVVLVGHANSSDLCCNVISGTKVRKFHTSRRDAFKVVNDIPIAKAYENKIEILKSYNLRNQNKVSSDVSFEEKVALLKFYPGQDSGILDYYLKNKYKGIVLEMGALGHVSTSRSRTKWSKKLKEVIDKGLIVCGTSQCIYGRTDPLVYSNGRELVDAGVIYLDDMLSETAFVKLGWVLGHSEWACDKNVVKEKMLFNFSNELNDRLLE